MLVKADHTILMFVVFLMLWTGDARAQGRLGKIRDQVRANDNHQPRQSRRDDNRDRDNHDDRREENRRDEKRRRQRNDRARQRASQRSSGFIRSCVSTGISFCEPTTVVEVYSPPVVPMVAAVPVNSPIPISSAVPVASLPAPVAAPITNPAPAIGETYFSDSSVQDVGIDDIPYASNWFSEWGLRGTAVVGGLDGMTSAGLGVLLQAPQGLGLDVSAKTWRENGASFRDHLWLGDANLVYEFANSELIRSRVGVGVNWLGDGWGGEAGFNLTAGLDIKLTERWLVALEGDIGTLGASDYLHSQVSLARRFETTELVVGFEHYDIGGVELQSVFGGMQFRF